MLRLLGWNRIGCGKGIFKGFVERLLLTLALALLEIAIILVRVFGLNNHFDFSASAAAPKITHRSPLFHYRSASLVRERLASVATESDAGHTLLPNQKSELGFETSPEGRWISESSKANRIETMKGPAESEEICSVEVEKIAKKIAKNKRCYANTLRPAQGCC